MLPPRRKILTSTLRLLRDSSNLQFKHFPKDVQHQINWNSWIIYAQLVENIFEKTYMHLPMCAERNHDDRNLKAVQYILPHHLTNTGTSLNLSPSRL